jgi:hypothetical protein
VRRALVGLGAAAVLLVAPATASADVIFDQADADELADSLAEAYAAQGVCYGWHVDVDNVGIMEASSGSNFGAGTRLQDADEFASCNTTVEFQASIQWTSESSESEDSASYRVESLPSGPTTSDLDSLEIISTDGLEGDNVDAEVYKAVAALPLLAADAGVAQPLEASPAPETAADEAGGQPTNSPGSDFLRQAGGALLFGVVLVVAGGVFAFWTWRSSSARRRAANAPAEPGGGTLEYVPPEWYDPRTAPPGVSPPLPRTQPGRSGSRRSGTGKPPGSSAGPGSGQPGRTGSGKTGRPGRSASSGGPGSGGQGSSGGPGSGGQGSSGGPGSGQAGSSGGPEPGRPGSSGGPGSGPPAPSSGPETGQPARPETGQSDRPASEPPSKPPSERPEAGRSSQPDPGGQQPETPPGGPAAKPADSPNSETRPEE